jgi:hypothetical protein
MDKVAPGSGRYIAVMNDASSVYNDPNILKQAFHEINIRGYTMLTLQECLKEEFAYRSKNELPTSETTPVLTPKSTPPTTPES